MVVLIDTNVIIDFLLKREPFSESAAEILQICSVLFVTGASHEEVLRAIENEEFGDFEDCLQDRCAKSKGARYIITRNVKDFDGSEIRAVSPQEFLDIIRS